MDASNSILPIHRTHSNSLYLGRKSSVAYGAFERSFLRMAPVMDLQRGVARKCLVADITCGVSTHCNRSYLFTIASRHFHTLLPSVKAICNPRFERKLSVTNARGERERGFNLIVQDTRPETFRAETLVNARPPEPEPDRYPSQLENNVTVNVGVVGSLNGRIEMNRTGSNPFFQRNLFIYISNIHSFDFFFAQKKGYKIDICARKLCIYIRIYIYILFFSMSKSDSN